VRDHEGRYPLLADEDLISLVGDGDAQAFAVLYDRHSRAAYSLAYRMMNGRQAAEDLAQVEFGVQGVTPTPREAPTIQFISAGADFFY
jgi:hypothetical protein